MPNPSWIEDVIRPSPGTRSLLPPGGFFSSKPGGAADPLFEAPLKLLAVVLLELHDKDQSRWLLVEQDLAAPAPGRWVFPNEQVCIGEMPWHAAERSLTEQVCLLEDGLPLGWATAEYRVLSVDLEWLTELALTDGSCTATWENTLVLAYHAKLPVTDLRRIEACDKRARQGRQLRLASILDVQAAIADGTLGAVSERVWQGYWQRGAA